MKRDEPLRRQPVPESLWTPGPARPSSTAQKTTESRSVLRRSGGLESSAQMLGVAPGAVKAVVSDAAVMVPEDCRLRP